MALAAGLALGCAAGVSVAEGRGVGWRLAAAAAGAGTGLATWLLASAACTGLAAVASSRWPDRWPSTALQWIGLLGLLASPLAAWTIARAVAAAVVAV